MEPTQQCWSRDSTTDRVDAPALAAILEAVTSHTPPHVLTIALKRPLLLPASRAATIAAHLTRNTPRWINDLNELNGTAPASPDNGAQFIKECARWLRDAAITNEPVHCLPGHGPFEIEPQPETIETPDTNLDQPHTQTTKALALANFAKDLDPNQDIWVHRLLTEQFINATIIRSTKTADDRQALIETPPALTGSARFDGYLAAIAHHIATSSGLPTPAWTTEPARNGPETDYFPSDARNPETLEQIRADTPTEFAARNIYIHNPDVPELSAPTKQPEANEDYR